MGINLISGVNVADFLEMLLKLCEVGLEYCMVSACECDTMQVCSRKCEESLHDCRVDGSMILFYCIPGTRLSNGKDWDTTFCNVVCKALHASHAEGGRT